MTDVVDRIADVLREDLFYTSPSTGKRVFKYANPPVISGDDAYIDALPRYVAERVAEAVQLTEETADIPTWSDTGEMVPNPMVQGPDMVPKRRLDFIPSRRWVSGWSAVEGDQP